MKPKKGERGREGERERGRAEKRDRGKEGRKKRHNVNNIREQQREGGYWNWNWNGNWNWSNKRQLERKDQSSYLGLRFE